MNTLTEITRKFAALDGIEEGQHVQYEKSLRNLCQRNNLPPTEQRGRVFHYDQSAAVAIRLAQIANEFGVSRPVLQHLAYWLAETGERRTKVPGGWLGVSHAREAVERTKAGEEFAISVICGQDWRFRVEADWGPKKVKDPELQAAIQAAGRAHAPEIARLTLPASEIIASVLSVIGE
ncbi:hypothetical protein [Mangrovicoccus ximenensis]|uniref:hypothetical protein n=1 Tax=Mangrovicoccus ximenensis TaxID=1911570 RepID=UPI000D347C72|nr:hypothetical protein [Mangrovicoccus ximenensis]